MFETLRKNHRKYSEMQRFFNTQDPIDRQILSLIEANELSIDIIPLKEQQQKPKKQRK